MGLLDNAGALVVEYKYDAWGRPVAVTGSKKDTLGKLNPFRYRGYVYDEETGLYYLRSRYYNPEWGRFVNADILLGRVGALGSHNLFAYCRNNSIIRVDPDGNVDILAPEAYGPGWGVVTIYITLVTPTWLKWLKTKVSAVSKAISQWGSSAGSKTVSASNAKVEPKSTPEPDRKYYFCFAVYDYSPIPMAGPYTKNEVLEKIYDSGDWVAVFDDMFHAYGGNESVNGYGVYTTYQSDAYELASYFSPIPLKKPHCADGNKLPHYHSNGASYNRDDLHFWYGISNMEY